MVVVWGAKRTDAGEGVMVVVWGAKRTGAGEGVMVVVWGAKRTDTGEGVMVVVWGAKWTGAGEGVMSSYCSFAVRWVGFQNVNPHVGHSTQELLSCDQTFICTAFCSLKLANNKGRQHIIMMCEMSHYRSLAVQSGSGRRLQVLYVFGSSLPPPPFSPLPPT